MAKIKALISCAVIAQLICAFVFVYAKNRFSHDPAQIELVVCLNVYLIESQYGSLHSTFISIISQLSIISKGFIMQNADLSLITAIVILIPLA